MGLWPTGLPDFVKVTRDGTTEVVHERVIAQLANHEGLISVLIFVSFQFVFFVTWLGYSSCVSKVGVIEQFRNFLVTTF